MGNDDGAVAASEFGNPAAYKLDMVADDGLEVKDGAPRKPERDDGLGMSGITATMRWVGLGGQWRVMRDEERADAHGIEGSTATAMHGAVLTGEASIRATKASIPVWFLGFWVLCIEVVKEVAVADMYLSGSNADDGACGWRRGGQKTHDLPEREQVG